MDQIIQLEKLIAVHSISPALRKEIGPLIDSIKKESRTNQFVISRLQEDKKTTENFLNNTVLELEKKNTELHKIANERKLTNERLVSINQELEQFAYIISHDLQEPLRTILDFAKLIERKKGDLSNEETEKYLSFIVQASQRMRILIKAILEYSTIGKTGTKSIIDCNMLLQEVIRDLSTIITEKQARIHSEHMPEIFGFPHEFYSLFQNLLSNALKYSQKETPPEIWITCTSAKNHWQLSIKDNGIGFDPKFRERVFVIFQRLHNPSTMQGSGIGLARCKKIVELHGGNIWAESLPSRGSIFHFTLPKIDSQ